MQDVSSLLNLEVIGEGATTKIYLDGSKAVKLYINAPPNEVENEARLQSFAYNAGLPVPEVYGIRRIADGAVALEMEYIPGKTLMHANMDKNERHNAINSLASLQCMVHSVSADGLPKQKDRLKWKIERTKHLDADVKNSLLDLLERLHKGHNSLCHGDFHPLNVLFDGQKHWIIDWVDATCGDPLADACRSYLIFKQHMTRASGIYLRMFCKAAKVKQEDVLAWLPVVTAARLNEKLDDKGRTFLSGIIEEWYHSKDASCLGM